MKKLLQVLGFGLDSMCGASSTEFISLRQIKLDFSITHICQRK